MSRVNKDSSCARGLVLGEAVRCEEHLPWRPVFFDVILSWADILASCDAMFLVREILAADDCYDNRLLVIRQP